MHSESRIKFVEAGYWCSHVVIVCRQGGYEGLDIVTEHYWSSWGLPPHSWRRGGVVGL
jgi:hypothetical protein